MKELMEKFIDVDSELWQGWQANIAMCFYDEYYRQKNKQSYLNKKEILDIANKAAKNFLNMLIKSSQEKEGE